MATEETPKKNKIDSVAKLLPGIGAIIAGVFIPLVIHWDSETNRNSQLYAEIVSQRETADSDLRARMFENLIRGFFGDGSQAKSDNERITILRLLALNFHESFDLKPLFEDLDTRLTGDQRQRLRAIADELRGRQEAMLSTVTEGMIFEEGPLYVGEENGILVPPSDEPAYRNHRLGIVVTAIDENDSHVTVRVSDIPDKKTVAARDIGNIVETQFSVGYFDMPFIDNTKLFNGVRYAVVLESINIDGQGQKSATLKVIFFPDAFMNVRDRPHINEILYRLQKSDTKENAE